MHTCTLVEAEGPVEANVKMKSGRGVQKAALMVYELKKCNLASVRQSGLDEQYYEVEGYTMMLHPVPPLERSAGTGVVLDALDIKSNCQC